MGDVPTVEKSGGVERVHFLSVGVGVVYPVVEEKTRPAKRHPKFVLLLALTTHLPASS